MLKPSPILLESRTRANRPADVWGLSLISVGRTLTDTVDGS